MLLSVWVVCWARLQLCFVASKKSGYKFAACQDVHGRSLKTMPSMHHSGYCMGLQNYHVNRSWRAVNDRSIAPRHIKRNIEWLWSKFAWSHAIAALALSTVLLDSQLWPRSCCNWLSTAYNVSSLVVQRQWKYSLDLHANALHSCVGLCLNTNCFWLWVLMNQTGCADHCILADLLLHWHVADKLSNEP